MLGGMDEKWYRRLAKELNRRLPGRGREQLSSITGRVDDSPGWSSMSAAPHDRDAAEIQELYRDALTAWRKNPLAKRIIDTTTTYALGDGIELAAPGEIGRFLNRWWHHPKNHMPTRLPDLVDELGRAGDLFITLHRNEQDGMSYIRVVPKDRIEKIETAPNDWETELAYYETQKLGEPRRWLSADHPAADEAQAVMLHYAVNRPVGALLGESDLAPVIPWLVRYSRLLEDRVRLNWALRAFLWVVTVPTNKVQAKQEQYRKPPDTGSIIIKDPAESWEPVTPLLRSGDASHDLLAVRRMISAGSYPPHWLGDPSNTNLATAKAMNDPAIRHLRRRQLYIRTLVRELAHVAYCRAHAAGKVRRTPDSEAVQVSLPDISREDNASLAVAAADIARALASMQGIMASSMPSEFKSLALQLLLKFAGEPLSVREIARLLEAPAGE